MMPYINTFTIILLIFGIDLILFAYLCGFLFSKSNSAFKAFPLINFFLIYSVPWVLVNIFSRYAFLSKLMQIIAFIFSPFYVLDKAFGTINEDFDISNVLLSSSEEYMLILIF